MHELAICQSLIQQLNEIASEHPASRIAAVHLQIGPLSGVEPRLLQEAFPIASAGTVADGAELNFQNSPVRIRCPECGNEQASNSNQLSCESCGNWQTELISGDEMILQRVELETSTPETIH